jgi:rubrerythrin
MNLFSAGEIIQVGIRIEINGREFYRAAAAASSAQPARQLFVFLADEETRHEKVFRGMLGQVERYEPPENYTEEYYEYLHTLAKDYVFTRENGGKEAGERITGELQAIDIAMGFEKDSILLYHEMKNLVPDYEHAAIDALIAQEQGHLMKLVRMKAALK